MSLRNRLLVGFGVVLLTLAVSIVVIVTTQRAYLVDQVDRELSRARPLLATQTSPAELPAAFVPPPIDESTLSEISEVYIGEIARDDGELRKLFGPEFESEAPDLSVKQLDALGAEGAAFSAGGQESSTAFRVLAIPRSDGGTWGIIAVPLTRTDDAIQRLLLTLVAGAVLILAALALTGWWIVRLGLRPIARVTAAADAITAGARGRRVALDEPRTEAGRLGHAFNVMLDDRDEAESRLRQFVADASHELRTPLTSIRGYLDVYAEGGFREAGELDDVVRRMRAESNRMNDLVEDLLLLANLDQGRPMAREPVDLGDVLRDATNDGSALETGRTIDVVAPDSGELVVTGDAARLRQVVAALVHNAVVHTPPDVRIQVEGRRRGDDALVSVTDDGPGLAAEMAIHVFDRFYRGDPSRSRHAGGSGLGLPIAKSIVEAHHGVITLETAPGRGCTFSVSLPMTERLNPD